MKNLANRIRKIEEAANLIGEKWFVIKGSKDADWSKLKQGIVQANPGVDLNYIYVKYYGEYLEPHIIKTF